jgi:sulfur-oxidizing protein SoxB
VAEHLRDKQTIHLEKIDTPRLKGVAGNPGIADYSGELI